MIANEDFWLDGFDYASYLKKHGMAGQIDPWRRTDEGRPLYCLLVSTDMAIEECKGWSGQDFTKSQFLGYLKLNDILALTSNIEVKNQISKFRLEEAQRLELEQPIKRKRKVSPEELERRKKQMKSLNGK